MTNLSTLYGDTSSIRWYEKQAGSDGATSETVFTTAKAYALGLDTLMVFVNGQKAEKVTTATNATEYEETTAYTVTFGASLQAADVVEFIVIGLQPLSDADFDTINDGWLGSNPTAGMKNKIINGCFRVWQRGVSFSNPASLSYTADRMNTAFNGNADTWECTLESFTPGQSDVPDNPQYFIRWNCSVAFDSQTYNAWGWHLEDVRLLAGKTVTFSFYAKSSDASVMNSIVARQYFGSGGSANVDTTISSSQQYTTDWVRYDYTITVPAITGKTLGAGNYLHIYFVLPINTTFEIDMAQAQLEESAFVTPFEYRPLATEVILCQRYHEIIGYFDGGGVLYRSGAGLASGVDSTIMSLKVLKYARPTMTIHGTWTVANCNQPTAAWHSHDMFCLGVTVTGTALFAYYTADSTCYITATAEI